MGNTNWTQHFFFFFSSSFVMVEVAKARGWTWEDWEVNVIGVHKAKFQNNKKKFKEPTNFSKYFQVS